MEKQVQKQRSILKDLNTAFLVLNPKKSLILSVEEDLGLIFYTKKLLVFSAVKGIGFRFSKHNCFCSSTLRRRYAS